MLSDIRTKDVEADGPEIKLLREIIDLTQDEKVLDEIVQVLDHLEEEHAVKEAISQDMMEGIINADEVDNLFMPNSTPISDEDPEFVPMDVVEPFRDLYPAHEAGYEEVVEEIGDGFRQRTRRVRNIGWDRDENLTDERVKEIYDRLLQTIPQSIIREHFGLREDPTGPLGVMCVLAQCITRELFVEYFSKPSEKVVISDSIKRLAHKLTAKIYLGNVQEKESKRYKEKRELFQFFMHLSRAVDGKVWKAFGSQDVWTMAKLLDDRRTTIIRAKRAGLDKPLIKLQRKLRKIRDIRFVHDIPDGTPYLEAHRIANANDQKMCYTQCTVYGTLSRQRLWYAAWCCTHGLTTGHKEETCLRDCLLRFPILYEEGSAWRVILGMKTRKNGFNLTGTLWDLIYIHDPLELTNLYDFGIEGICHRANRPR